MVLAVLKSLRFHQWVKNLFVLGPLVFARRVDDPRAAVFGSFLLAGSVLRRGIERNASLPRRTGEAAGL